MVQQPFALGPFPLAWPAYIKAGWPCVLPIPPGKKTPPPTGYTGEAGLDTPPDLLTVWAGQLPMHSVALRMPAGVIGIDVDHYDTSVPQPDGSVKVIAKRGADTIAELEKTLGALPPTWSSTARGGVDGPGLSRVLLFRVPPQRYVTKLMDVEIIQRHHRYLMAAPSSHPSSGAAYCWYGPQGAPAEYPPNVSDLADLPLSWVEFLREGASVAGPASAGHADGETLLGAILSDHRPACFEVVNAADSARRAVQSAEQGSRHDTAVAATHALVMTAAAGHPGAAEALTELLGLWNDATSGEDREAEFVDMLVGSARKAVTQVRQNTPVAHDPCLTSSWIEQDAAMPVDGGGDPELVESFVDPDEHRRYYLREIIGAHPFAPLAATDQGLAEAVLERGYRQLRYSADTRTWVSRRTDRWETSPADLAPWMVAEAANLAPYGDPDAPKDTEAYRIAQTRKRLNANSTANAVAGKMKALVSGGLHPVNINLTGVDGDPEILWAGGLPWDLRASLERPTVAERIALETPHLKTTRFIPEQRATPLWDDFVAAIWPDPEIRHWALNVISVSLTGYPDATLPILLGETGRGKTSLMALIMQLLGSYAISANPKLLGSHEGHDSIVYKLKGARLAFIDEGPRDGRAGQERLKQLTGGGALTGNAMNKDPIEFMPTHTLVLTANPENTPKLTDSAVRRRARLIPCDGDPELVRHTRGAIGPFGGRAWRLEAPGVLAQLMGRAAGWLLDPDVALTAAAPDSIRDLGADIAAEQDVIRRWVDEMTEEHPPGTPTNDLYGFFVAYCDNQGIKRGRSDLTREQWGTRLTQLGYPSLRLRATAGDRLRFRGLRIRGVGGLPPQGYYSSDTYENRFPVDNLVDNSDSCPGVGQPVPTPPGTANVQVTDVFTPPSPTVPTTFPITPDISSKTIQKEKGNILARPETPPPPGPPRDSDGTLTERNQPELPPPAVTESEKAPDKPLTPAAQRKLAERAAKLAEAAGPEVPFPTLVTRDGAVVHIEIPDANALLAAITDTDAALTVDVETTGYPVGHELYDLRTIQLGDDTFSVNLDAEDAEQRAVALHHLSHAKALHAHSATADVVPLTLAKLLDWDDAWDRMWDTAIPAALTDPGAAENDQSLGLKQLAAQHFGDDAATKQATVARKELFKQSGWLTDTKPTTPLERSGWAQVDSRCTTMQRYAGSDVLDTGALAKTLPEIPPAIWARERLAQRMTARITLEGLPLDADHVDALHAEHTQAKGELTAVIRDSYGIDNPGSAPQVAAKLIEMGVRLPMTKPSVKFPEGQPTVAAGVLEAVKHQPGITLEAGKLVGTILDYRHHATALSLFLETFWQLVHHGDGRVRSTIYTLGTDTGRMSSSRFNLQQLSRTGGIRKCVRADDGYSLISADFAGVEFRVAAALSQDPNLLRMLLEGVNMHKLAAAQVFGVDFTEEQKYAVKRGNFGWLYGGKPPTLATQMGSSLEKARELSDTLAAMLPGVVAWGDQLKKAARWGQTTFEAYSGRVIHLPSASHAIPNYCIQGTARELLVDGQIRWDGTRWGNSIMVPVHDEVLAMVPTPEADDATAALVQCMESELYGLPIVVEASEPSTFWQDAA
jgi:P4 family phage/plasmid primase-like protien